MGIEALLQDQAMLESRYAEFVASLDKRRIVTFKRFIEESLSVHKLKAPWLNHKLFVRRIVTAWNFLERVGHPRLPKRQRLVFFQSSYEREDIEEYRRKVKKDEMVRIALENRLKGAPPQALYMHVHGSWSHKLNGLWEMKNRKIPALGGFSNYGDSREIFPGERREILFSAVLGLRIPDWPKLLGVSSNVATDYFARIVIHDLGHAWLPDLDPSMDSFHNAVMLHATDTRDAMHQTSLWETVVHRECTDPFFYVDGFLLLRQCDSLELTPLQKHLLRKLRGYYDSKRHWAFIRVLWGIDPGWPLDEQRQELKKVVAEMCSNGFERYDPEWKPPE